MKLSALSKEAFSRQQRSFQPSAIGYEDQAAGSFKS
jgi:hypothetical protein